MSFWVSLLTLVPSIVAGWVLSGHFFKDRAFRFLTAPIVGLSFGTSFFCLFDSWLPPPSNAVLSGFLVAVIALVYSRGDRSDALESPALGNGQKSFIAILALFAWIYSQGRQQLFPQIDFLLWDLSAPEPGTRSPLLGSASLFASDPWLGTLIFLGVSQVFVTFAAFSLARLCLDRGSWGWMLGGVFLLASTESAWLVFQAPSEVLTHLWGLTALLFITKGKRNLLGISSVCLAALCLVRWQLALALLLVIPQWTKRTLLAIATIALMQSLYFHGPSLGLALAVSLLFYGSTRADSIGASTLRLCLLELLFSAQGLFAFTGFALEAGKRLEFAWRESEPGKLKVRKKEIQLPKRGVLATICLIVLWYGVDGAETVFNDAILIAAQKERVTHLKLIRPHSFPTWLAWRGPAFGFSEKEQSILEKVRELEGKVVYLSGSVPDPRASSLVASAGGKELLGWSPSSEGPRLDSELALYLATGQTSALLDHPADFLVQPQTEPIPIPKTNSSPNHTSFSPLVKLAEPKGEPVSMESLLRADISRSQSREIPAASLIPIEVTISNPCDLELDLSIYRGIRFQPTYPHRKPLAPIDYPAAPVQLGKLSPGEKVVVTAYLRTDNFPLDYDLNLTLSKEDGTSQGIRLKEPVVLKSFRTELPLDLPFGEQP